MIVKDSFEGGFVFNTERFRLDYLQDLKKEANQRAQAQAAIVSLLLPTVLLLADHFSKKNAFDGFNLFVLASSLFLLLGSLAMALVVLVPIQTGAQSKFAAELIPTTSLAERSGAEGWELDVASIREEARSIAVLLLRRDRLLRMSAVLLGSAIVISALALVRYLV